MHVILSQLHLSNTLKRLCVVDMLRCVFSFWLSGHTPDSKQLIWSVIHCMPHLCVVIWSSTVSAEERMCLTASPAVFSFDTTHIGYPCLMVLIWTHDPGWELCVRMCVHVWWKMFNPHCWAQPIIDPLLMQNHSTQSSSNIFSILKVRTSAGIKSSSDNNCALLNSPKIAHIKMHTHSGCILKHSNIMYIKIILVLDNN